MTSTPTPPAITISYGGGHQSTAMCILDGFGKHPEKAPTARLAELGARFREAAGGPVDAALFSNVGDDSEHPATITYVREVAIPWGAAHGLTIHELNKVTRDGNVQTLYQQLMREGSRSLPIPVRMSNGAPGTRSCTTDYKVRVIDRWLRLAGVTPDDPAVTLIGISTDEVHRMKNHRTASYSLAAYPLIDLGLDRSACDAIITEAGLPIPPKSACYFCPFHDRATWSEMRRDEPALFWQAVHLEATLNDRRDHLPCPGEATAPKERLREVYECPTHGDLCDFEPYADYEDGRGCPDWTTHDEVEPWAGKWLAMAEGTCPRCRTLHTLDPATGLLVAHGKHHVFLSRYGKPLDVAIGEAQPTLTLADGPEGCDEGYCWT